MCLLARTRRQSVRGCGGGTIRHTTFQRMTTTIELEDDDAEHLLAVLEANADAVSMQNAARWTPEASDRIKSIHAEVQEQVNQ